MPDETDLTKDSEDALIKSPEKAYEKQEWVCSGKNLQLNDKTRGIEFRRVMPSGELGPPLYYGLKKFRRCNVGIVYSIDVSDNSCRPDTLRYVRSYQEKELVKEWEAEELARSAELSRLKALSSAKDKLMIEENLKPLRDAYLKCSSRVGFELVVLRYLRTGKFNL